MSPSNRDPLDVIKEFTPDQIKVPDVDLVFIGTLPKATNAEEAARHHHKELVLTENHYIISYAQAQRSFLEDVIKECGTQVKANREQIRNTPTFVEAVERNRTAVADVHYGSSPSPSSNVQVDPTKRLQGAQPRPGNVTAVKNSQDGVQSDRLRPDAQDASEQTTDPTPRRAKSWTVSDKILFALLLIFSIAALGADFAVIYIYLTSTDKLPGLVDNPDHAYFWAALPIIVASVLAMLPYYSSRETKLRSRLGYGLIAILLFILAWVPAFAGLFSIGLSDTQDVLEQLWRNAPSIGGQYDEILKWLFMAGQILSLVLASSTSWLSILIMIEDRRVERLIRNQHYDELVARGNGLERELALANHKAANHAGITGAIKRKAQELGEKAVALLRAACGKR